MFKIKAKINIILHNIWFNNPYTKNPQRIPTQKYDS